jgi:signal transduction histidine kinase
MCAARQSSYTGVMSATLRPEAIDSRLVLHVYACIAIPLGLIAYMWPTLTGAAADPSSWFASMRIVSAAIAGVGALAAALTAIEEPLGRRRALLGFAHAHILFGVLFLLQWIAALANTIPSTAGWAPLIVGLVLLYLAITGPGGDYRPRRAPLLDTRGTPGATSFAVRSKPGLDTLRSQYEEDIRQAARHEERARLARDLHDAVKQQLFVIQTAAATVQARLDADVDGAKEAIEQVRSAAREAMTEMEAMLDQLQSAPLANAGLVASLRKQCEALGFRTGAQVSFVVGVLPPDAALDPGARQAVFRVAQEALANVARHARARTVSVSLDTAGSELVLTVRDDGAGFEAGAPARGMGMSNIAARAAEVGGSVDVASAPNHGTAVRFALPFDQLPSLWPYAARAALWIVVLAAAIAMVASTGLGARPWGAAVAVIAGIAVARYIVAIYRLSARQAIA